ncbi:MAG: hypothetical protein NT178_15105 [Proteobacteria bacterium]|nr:hypothetical protein [Pseudomonadota bacterium]
MKLKVKKMINIPEIPDEVKMETGTLRDFLNKVLADTHFVKEIIDSRTGELRLDDLFEVRLNDVLYYTLPQGLDTGLQDGDTITVSLILLGGG